MGVVPRFCLSPYEYRRYGDDGARWCRPMNGGVAAMDLRKRDDRMSHQTHGVALFVHDDPTFVPELDLGDDIGGRLNAVQRDGIKRLTGISGTISSMKLGDAIAELKLIHGDPAGEASFRLDRGVLGGRSEMRTGSIFWRTHDITRSSPEWINRVTMFRAKYKKARAKVTTQAELDHLRKWTGYEMRLNRLSDSSEILPPEHVEDGSMRPTTTLGDTFQEDSGDVDLDAHTATGTGGGFAWTEISGVWVVVAATDHVEQNLNTGLTMARADTNLSSDAHEATLDILAWGAASTDRMGPMVRVQNDDATTEDGYYAAYRNNGGDIELESVEAGSIVEVATQTYGDALPVTIKVDITAGDALQGYVDGVGMTSGPFGSQTLFDAEVRTGIMCRGVNPADTHGDNFTADDGAGGAVTSLYHILNQ